MKRNIFRMDEENRSYRYPILKIVIFVAVLLLCALRYHFFQLSNSIARGIVEVLCCVIAIAGIFCIYIACAELLVARENRSKDKPLSDKTKGKRFSVGEIVSMAKDNAIIEITIISGKRRIELGSSADCRADRSEFFDKRYYIEKAEFETVEEFGTALLPYANDGELLVVSIDGIPQK